MTNPFADKYLPVSYIWSDGKKTDLWFVRRLEEDHLNYYVWYGDDLEPKIYQKGNYKFIQSWPV